MGFSIAEIFGLIPEDVIKYFRAKGYKLSWNWQDTWKEQHAKAFTVAHCMKLNILQDIRDAMDAALAEGKTFQQFKDGLQDTLREKGWWGQATEPNPKTGEMETYQAGSPARLRTVCNTNFKTAYAAGNYKFDKTNAGNQPLWMYSAVMDSRTRPEHAALDGKVYRADDPFWDKYYPPNDWGCRCQVVPLDDGQAEAMGKAPGKWDGTPMEGVPEEWQMNPGKEGWEPDLSKYDPDLVVQYNAGLNR